MEALKEAQEDSCIDKHCQYSRGYLGNHREPVFLCLVTKWTLKDVNHIFFVAAGLQINLLKSCGWPHRKHTLGCELPGCVLGVTRGTRDDDDVQEQVAERFASRHFSFHSLVHRRLY